VAVYLTTSGMNHSIVRPTRRMILVDPPPPQPLGKQDLEREQGTGRHAEPILVGNEDDEDDEEANKKFRFETDYDSFAIYDRVLCLVVTRRLHGRSDPIPNPNTNPSTRTNVSVEKNPAAQKHTVANNGGTRSGTPVGSGDGTGEGASLNLIEGWIQMSQAIRDHDIDHLDV
jgi:hypothetical protein